MKKIITVIAICGTLMACNNDAASSDNKKDSIDSVANEKKEMIDSTAEQRKDAVDSVAERKKEALDRADSANRKDTTRNRSGQ